MYGVIHILHVFPTIFINIFQFYHSIVYVYFKQIVLWNYEAPVFIRKKEVKSIVRQIVISNL